jgi:hypothetical protein
MLSIFPSSMPTSIPSWTQEFLTKGGYSALLTRLNELLEVEWRSVDISFLVNLY